MRPIPPRYDRLTVKCTYVSSEFWQSVERARYDADLAARRFRQVDPDNRLVAAVLEAEWNERLRLLTEAQATYDQQCQADRHQISAHDRATLVDLTANFPRLWRDPRTPDRERKRIARLLLADVTVTKQDDHILAQARFVGGATHTLQVPLGMAQTGPIQLDS